MNIAWIGNYGRDIGWVSYQKPNFLTIHSATSIKDIIQLASSFCGEESELLKNRKQNKLVYGCGKSSVVKIDFRY